MDRPPLVIPGVEPKSKQLRRDEPVAVAEEPVVYQDSEAEAPTAVAPEVNGPPSAPDEHQAPLMTVEAAMDRIGTAVLAEFKKQFNGKPTEMRHLNAKDRIFERENES